jgi:hypothetical protein
MTNEEFKCWINGYITLSSDDFFNLKQYRILKNHANLVEAMTGDLDPQIAIFLSHLQSMLNDKHSLPINDFRKCAKDMLNVS